MVQIERFGRKYRPYIPPSVADLRLLQAALQHHPDKVPEERRAESEVKFKAVTQAYEILRDDEKRHLYDTHGMAAFDPSRGGGAADVDLNDILAQMFGMNMGGNMPKRARRGHDEEQQYKVTLEELYKGKTVKFAANKRVGKYFPGLPRLHGST